MDSSSDSDSTTTVELVGTTGRQRASAAKKSQQRGSKDKTNNNYNNNDKPKKKLPPHKLLLKSSNDTTSDLEEDSSDDSISFCLDLTSSRSSQRKGAAFAGLDLSSSSSLSSSSIRIPKKRSSPIQERLKKKKQIKPSRDSSSSSSSLEKENNHRARATVRSNKIIRSREPRFAKTKKKQEEEEDDDDDDDHSHDDNDAEEEEEEEYEEEEEEEDVSSDEEEQDYDTESEASSVSEDSASEEEFVADTKFDATELQEFERPSMRRATKPRRKVAVRNELPKIPKPLTTQEKEQVLQKIKLPQDRALQKLLFDQSFRFSLYEHQFEAVRRVAAVPANFPLHHGTKAKDPLKATLAQAVRGLDLPQNRPQTRGFCLADGMGLGKTIESIGGAILARALAALSNNDLPVLIVAPNDAVQQQWRDSLLLNGVPLESICMFEKGRKSNFGDAAFILLTRYTAQAEIKALWSTSRKCSQLFPHVSRANLKIFKEMYNYSSGSGDPKTRVDHRREIADKVKEQPDDTVTHMLKVVQRANKNKGLGFIFQLVVVDESHFLKNRLALWSMAVALAALHSHRVVPCSGTPYNNGVGDLASCHALIDPAGPYAKTLWWTTQLDVAHSTNMI